MALEGGSVSSDWYVNQSGDTILLFPQEGTNYNLEDGGTATITNAMHPAGNDITLEFYVKLTGTSMTGTTPNGRIISWDENQMSWIMYHDVSQYNTDKWALTWYLNGKTEYLPINTKFDSKTIDDFIIPSDEFVTITSRVTSEGVATYVNGKRVALNASLTPENLKTLPGNNSLAFKHSKTLSNRKVYGNLLSVRVYPRALTDTEIAYNHDVDIQLLPILQ